MTSEELDTVIVHCDDCGGEVAKRLIDRGNGPEVKLTCGCTVFDKTQGIHVPFENDLPEQWYSTEDDQ